MFENLGVDRKIVWDFVDSYKMRYKDISVAQTLLLENAFEAVTLASKFARLEWLLQKQESIQLQY